MSHRIQDIGILPEETFGTNVITSKDVLYYHIGLIFTEFMFPIKKQTIVVEHLGDSRDPSSIEVTKTWVEGNIPFEFVNGYPFFFALAHGINTDPSEAAVGGISQDATSNPNTIYTIDPIDDGECQAFDCKWETSDGSNRIQMVATGCRVHTLTASIEFTTNSLLVGMFQFRGQQLVEQIFTPRTSPVWPDGNATSTQRPYKYGDNTVVTWDGDDIKKYMDSITINVITTQTLDTINGQSYPQFIRSGVRGAIGIAWNMGRQDYIDIFTDFLAQEAADTFKTLIFKIYATPTKYIKFTFSNVAINMDLNHAIETSLQKTKFLVVGLAKGLILEFVDGTVSERFDLVAP